MPELELVLNVRTGWGAERAKLKAIPGRADAELYRAVEDGTGILERSAHEEIPKSGKAAADRPPERPFPTEDTILSSVESDAATGRITGRVGADDLVAVVLERGSKAHVITPRVASALRFRVGGRLVFAQRVEHPGTRPYEWLTRAGLKSDAQIRDRLDRAGTTIFEEPFR